MRAVPHFVHGALVEKIDHSPDFNLATGKVIAKVPVPSLDFVNDVATATQESPLSWATASTVRVNLVFPSTR